MKFFIVFSLFTILMSCQSPVLNQSRKDEVRFSQLGPQISNSETGLGSNLLASRGCPIPFPKAKLCGDIEWLDDKGLPANGPIYWANFWEKSMSAILLFWSAKDGWPVEPLQEAPAVKGIQIKLFMPTHGHGSEFPIIEEIPGRVGQFKVSNLQFIMGRGSVDAENPWEVRVQLKSTEAPFSEDPHDPEDQEIFEQFILKFIKTEDRD